MLGSVVPTSAEYQQRLADQLLTESLPAKSHLTRAGEICRRLYFIESGIVRSYHIDDYGNECTNWFMGEGDLACAATSFFEQKPSLENIELLQDSVLVSITWNQLNALYADFNEANLIGRVMAEKYLVIIAAINMQRNTPKIMSRYANLLRQHPNIEQLTTQGNIASYLGITRETLSRLKAELIRNK
ncbi:Crp/Fnr family transcriptional regulator [Pedobacter xixiisoli]|nr:Crp/Fnr family transcriptional regulator [Pedobacter xixiisoli]